LKRTLAEMLIILMIILLLLLLFPRVYGEGTLYISTDSCSYEIYRDLMKTYPNLTGEIAILADLNGIKISSYRKVVFLGTSASLQRQLSEVVERLTKDPPKTLIVSQYVGEYYGIKASSYVPDEYIWKYCLYRDDKSLYNIAEIIWRSNGEPAQSLSQLLPFLAALSVGTIATSYLLSKHVGEFIEKLRTALIKLIGLIALPVLRVKLEREEVLNHPLRKSIYDYVSSKVVVRLSDLMRELKLPRGTTEWHLHLLVKYGLVRELRVGRKRYVVDFSKPHNIVQELVSKDEDFKCVWELVAKAQGYSGFSIDEKTISEVSDKCGLDPREVEKIMNAINYLQTL